MKDITVLGIETSCDETSAAVVVNGRTILSNIIASQVELHSKFGGVVPEIASRKHVELILPVINQALEEACVRMEEIDAIGVTYGPGACRRAACRPVCGKGNGVHSQQTVSRGSSH